MYWSKYAPSASAGLSDAVGTVLEEFTLLATVFLFAVKLETRAW
jgi:hypothetical protein